MEHAQLTGEIGKLLDLKACKEEAAAIADEAKSAFEEQKTAVINMMVDHAEGLGLGDPSAFSLVVNGRRVKATMKDFYSIKAADRQAGFPALRVAGLGDLIQERVDDRSLTNAIKAEIENNGGALPERFAAVPLSVYSKPDLSIQKA